METSFVVVTSIQSPTPCMRRLADAARERGFQFVVIGDRKGPEAYELPPARLVRFDEQAALPFQLGPLLPVGHYARKNLGYLLAVQGGAGVIYETDDDNAPLPHWVPRDLETAALPVSRAGWCNVFRAFTQSPIWPRGLPLDEVRSELARQQPSAGMRRVRAAIQQGLANGAPDVDAIWRLTLDQEVNFDAHPPLVLEPRVWCPFNSQNTWWWPEVFPLLYLPSHCSFRMTDIWRSFVAQRCLWEIGQGVVFFGADVRQERNPHNLLRDFRDEIPGYLRNREIADLLGALDLSPFQGRLGDCLRRCYQRLVEADVVPAQELTLVEAWLADLGRMRGSGCASA